MAYLEIQQGDRTWRANLSGATTLIGRHPESTLVIADPDMSRQHCVIERQGNEYRLVDLKSRNGSKLNGQPVEQRILKHGDTIRLGGTTLQFKEPDRAKALLTWGRMAACALLGLVIGVAGTTWMRGGFAPAENQAVAGNPRAADDTSRRVTSATGASVDTTPSSSLSVDDDSDYQVISSDTIGQLGPSILGRPVQATFFGAATTDADGSLRWEMPPDGLVRAMLKPGSVVFDALAREPMMLEVQLYGILRAATDGPGYRLDVGEVRIIRPWSGDAEKLRAATRAVLGRRCIVNDHFTLTTFLEARSS